MKGGDLMTVGAQIQKAVASVESVASSMKTFALETEDQQAKQMYQQMAQTFDAALNTLKERQKYIEQQEPQYKQ
jgi:broad specificity polyphosphatase/5'/3'-nucleotidase SurE